MIRRLLLPLLALVIGAWLAWALLRDPGYVLLQYGVWSVESTLPGMAALLLLIVLPLGLGLFLLRRLSSLPAQLRQRRTLREQQRSEADLAAGLRALAAGRWADAERWLATTQADAVHADLRCIGAALSASQQSDADAVQRLERWRSEARSRNGDAAALAWLDLRTAADATRWLAAVDVLLADRADPRPVYAAALLRAERSGNWPQFRELLDKALRAGAIDDATRWERPRTLLTTRLRQLEAGDNDPALLALLMERAPELDSAALLRLAQLRLQRDETAGLAEWIESVWAPAPWSEGAAVPGPQRRPADLCRLMRIYAGLEQPDAEQRLARLELRLSETAAQPEALAATQAAVAELCIGMERWNRARLALDQAQSAADPAWLWSMRARLNEASGRHDDARQCWKQAAETAMREASNA